MLFFFYHVLFMNFLILVLNLVSASKKYMLWGGYGPAKERRYALFMHETIQNGKDGLAREKWWG